MKSLQSYIDETPPRPLSLVQWRIWILAATGKFFEGMVIFLTGVAIPLIEQDFNLASALKGSVAAATLLGILVGASLFGNLADRLGRKLVFVSEMAIFTVFVSLTAIAWNVPSLIFFLFCVGVALGADYPTAHLIISESIPSSFRGRMVLGAFAFQSIGSLGGVLIGLLVLRINPEVGAWHWMYASLVIPGIIVFLLRTGIPESAHWLISHNRQEDAQRSAKVLLQRPVELADLVERIGQQRKQKYKLLFSPRYLRATILAAVPWFLQDLATYGIGIFTPTILATLFTKTQPNFIFKDMVAAEGSGAIDLFLLIGFLASILLIDKVGRIPLQIVGFIGCGLGLGIASLAAETIPEGHQLKVFLIFGGFIIFNFMTNLGPNAMTYVLAGEVFPVQIRGLGAGFAASFAKIGAVTTAFFFPILREQIGTSNLLHGLVITSLFGALVTFIFRIEPNGKSLENV
ncbi:MFS transporter [Microcystis aeruginosa CS-338/01]|uniref:MFS transporter n=1 Tax=Microcystis aeruginosa TaxID=1126 RepID=UPI002330F5A7|nr:MFS transporter [Microcystis aeruginosa]MDB9508211.1 MFS transporter [Microcystis aeruginosa CS-338/01]